MSFINTTLITEKGVEYQIEVNRNASNKKVLNEILNALDIDNRDNYYLDINHNIYTLKTLDYKGILDIGSSSEKIDSIGQPWKVSLDNVPATNEKLLIDITKHNFDVALSFAGEFRDYIEKVVFHLEKNIGKHKFFYDNNYISQLARPSLDTLLQKIYGKQSNLIVVFFGDEYQKKDWCGVEFKAIKEILMERNDDKIMFVKMNDGNVEGIFKTDGYIDGRKHKPEAIAEFIQERLAVITQFQSLPA